MQDGKSFNGENERELLKALNDDEKGQLRNLLQKVYDSIKSC